jgi:O-antigen/teichoic acid export membrane protein
MSSLPPAPLASAAFATRTLKGTLWGQIDKIIESALTLAFSVLVIRQLGPSDYGRYALVSGAVVISVMLTALGTNQVLASQVPRLLADGNARGARRLTQKVALARIAAILVGLAGLVVLRTHLALWFKTPEFAELVVWIAVFATLVNLAELSTGFLTALLEMRFVTIVRAFGIALSIAAAAVLFAWKGVSVRAALIASIVGWSAMGVATIGRSLRIIRRWPGGAVVTAPVIRYGLTVWSGTLLNSGLSMYSSVFMLGILASGPNQVGLYNAAVLPVGRLWLLMVGGLATIMLPTLAEVDARQGAAGLARVWRAYNCLFALLLLPTFSFFMVYSHPFVQFLFGKTYLPAARLMSVYLALSLFGTLCAGTVTINLFLATGRQALVLVGSAFGGLLDILLLLLLIPRLNALGAVIADGLANTATGVLLLVLLRRSIPAITYPFGLVLKTVAASLGALTAAYVLVPPNQIATTALSIILGLALFGGLCYLLKPLANEHLSLERLGPRFGQVAHWFGQPEARPSLVPAVAVANDDRRATSSSRD